MFKVLAYPLDSTDYANSLFPSSGSSNMIKESKPIQATDHGTDTPDSSQIATNFTSGNRPILATSFQRRNSSTYVRPNLSSNAPLQGDTVAYIPKPPRYPDYVLQTGRTSSFQSRLWDASNKPEVRTLVAFGFFFTGITNFIFIFASIGLDNVSVNHIQ